VLALALGLFSPVSTGARADELMHLTQNLPGDSKAIVVRADFIATWMDGGQRVILLRGNSLIEHGLLTARTDHAVIWTDQEGFKRSGVLRVDIYCEGNVTLESGTEVRSGGRAFVNLSTRGEIKLRSYQAKIAQEAHPEDEIYRRGVQTRNGPTIQQTSATQNPVPANQLPQVRVARAYDPDPVLPAQTPPAGNNVTTGQPGTPAPAQQDPGSGQSTPLTPIPAQAPPSTNPDPSPIGSTPTPPPPTSQPNPPEPQPATGVVPAPGPPRPGIIPPRDRTFREVTIKGRTIKGFEPQTFLLTTGETATVITGGVNIIVRTADNSSLVDIEADRLVTWTRGTPLEFMNQPKSADAHETKEIEFYLSGNVEIRDQNGPDAHVLRAEEVYYNVSRHTAIALNADVEFRQKGIPDPIHMRGEEINQLGEGLFRGLKVEVFSSRLPSDPGLKVTLENATLEEKDVIKKGFFGQTVIDRKTGQPEVEHQRLLDGNSVFIDLEGYPIFYLPYVRGDANDPLGPLESLGFSYDRIFGFQFRSTFNMYNLLGIDPQPDTRWKLDLDYLTERGPALGQYFESKSKNWLGLEAQNFQEVRAYGIYDTGTDILGGGRGPGDGHPDWRGRVRWDENVQELPEGFTVQSQVAPLSDKNFLEQYFKLEFDNDINQETFIYVKQQQDNWAWTFLTEQRIRDWVTETSWLPRVDGYLLGQSFFDVFTYNVRASAGYAHLQPTNVPPPPVEFTDMQDSTGRFDAFQELSIPFALGPFKVVPYANFDLTYYTDDLLDQDRGRVYGGGGVRASIPFTRLYPDVCSDLLNVNGINHKIVLSANYYYAKSDTPYTILPQLDQLNDNASDQALRDIKPLEPFFNPQYGLFIATSPLFDPQLYALRTLVDNRVDTLGTMEVLQLDLRQRWQTKRGYPGQEHITDWMTLDLSASYYPDPARDNFNQPFSFLQYDWNWNVGDRTAIFSSGWLEPYSNQPGYPAYPAESPSVFAIGTLLNRTDRTQFYLGYRQIDPLESKAVTAAVTYIFSPKYAATATVSYDFGVKEEIGSLLLTRTGTDLTMSLGFTYNSLVNTFGVTFVIVPNIVPNTQRTAAGLGTLGQGGLLSSNR
jgi:hypothetical protein